MTTAPAPPRNVARSIGAIALPCAWLGGALYRAGPLTSGRT